MSDPHQTFRISSIPSTNMIHDVKNDPILQVSRQEHPMSSNPKFRPDINHVRFSSKFQDIFLIIYWYDFLCQRWPHPSNLRWGTINILQVPNLYFFSLILSNLDQTFGIDFLATNDLIVYVQLGQTLKGSSQEQLTFSKPPLIKNYFYTILQLNWNLLCMNHNFFRSHS